MLVKKTNGRHHLQPTFTSLLDGFFSSDVPSMLFNREVGSPSVPSVNVVESDQGIRLEVAAPGFSKNDFNIDVKDNLLTISGEWKDSGETKGEKYTRKEFGYSSFKRTFTLPDTVDVDKIGAGYQRGILKIELPKVEEVKNPSKTIEIA